jgi:hypothetical protein
MSVPGPEPSGPDFIDPQRLFTTALGITVGLSWNTAVREAVDEYVDVKSAGGALWVAVLVTLLTIAVFYLANFVFRVAHSAFSSPETWSGGGAPKNQFVNASGRDRTTAGS